MTTGDGGIVTTNNKKFATRMRKLNSAGYKNLTASGGKIRINRDKFQNPKWVRHDTFAYNYRLSEICAAVGIAQLEKLNYFVKLQNKMGTSFLKVIQNTNSDLLIPQKTKFGYFHSTSLSVHYLMEKRVFLGKLL